MSDHGPAEASVRTDCAREFGWLFGWASGPWAPCTNRPVHRITQTHFIRKYIAAQQNEKFCSYMEL